MKKTTTDRMIAAVSTCFIALVFAAYAVIRIQQIFQVESFRIFPDSAGYLGADLFSADLWRGSRPFTIPLIYRLLDVSIQRPLPAVLFQVLFSLFCWGFLALQLFRTVRHAYVKPAAFVIVLLFSLSGNIIGWDTVILSESISLSLMALLAGCWLLLIGKWSRQRAAAMLLVSLLWCFARDTNAWLILAIASAAAVAGLVFRARRRYLAVSGILFLFFIASGISADLGRRWVFPLQNVIAQRILPVPENVTYFARRGMPVSSSLMRLSGGWASSNDGAFYQDPGLEGFRAWLHRKGKKTYMLWLLSANGTRPFTAVLDARLVTFSCGGYLAPGFKAPLPGYWENFIYPCRYFLPLLMAAVIVSAVILIFMVRSRFPGDSLFLAVPLFLFFSLYPHAFIVWHGDAMEIGRHSLPVGVQFYLSVWLFLLLGIDLLLGRITKKEGNIKSDR